MNDPVSEELAKSFGFEEVETPNAYNGVCYMKGDKIWIHDKKALMITLAVTEDHELEALKYDVKAYNDSRERYKELCLKYTQDAFSDAVYSQKKKETMTQYRFDGDTQTANLKGTLSIVTEDISIILFEKNRNVMAGKGLVDGELFQLTMSSNDYDEGAKTYMEIDSNKLDGKSISDITLVP